MLVTTATSSGSMHNALFTGPFALPRPNTDNAQIRPYRYWQSALRALRQPQEQHEDCTPRITYANRLFAT